MRYTVVFDACVLYPAPLRDFLLRLSMTGLFAAKWTNQIHDEWIRNVLMSRPELKDKLSRTRELMDKAVPDSLVAGYEPLMENLQLPDTDDRHVLAAAIRSGAQAIITFNLKDFPDQCAQPIWYRSHASGCIYRESARFTSGRSDSYSQTTSRSTKKSTQDGR